MRARRAKRLPLSALTPYLLEVPASPGPLDWSAVFGNGHSVELEVGFGKGLFLITAAQNKPVVNFVGVEIDRGLELYVANRVAKRQLKNVRLVRADARLLLRDYVAAGTLAAIHVYFPDPWWKKRHKKRRVFTPEFAAECERALSLSGKLHVATDVEEYFGVMTQLVAEHTRLRPIPMTALVPKLQFGNEPPEHDMDYLSNFERKARKQGKAVWQMTYEK